MTFVRRSLSLVAFLVIGLSLGGAIGCTSGTTQTSAGPRPSATVEAQDAVADVLKIADDTYKQAVAKHDTTPVCSTAVPQPCEDAAVHVKHRATLLLAARSLRAAWAGEIAWKESGDPTSARAAFCDLQRELPDFEGLVVGFGIVKQSDADTWLPIVASALKTAGGCP